MKKWKYYDEAVHMLYLGSIAALMLCGFFLEWLVKNGSFWQSVAAVLLPVLPAVLLYAWESEEHLLDESANFLKDKWYMAVLLPIVLVCLGVLLREERHDLNLYWSLSHLLCCYVAYVSVSGGTSIRCCFVLALTALFGWLSVFENVYAGSSIAIAVLGVFCLSQTLSEEREDALLPFVSYLALASMALCAVLPVLERLLFSAISQQTDIVLVGFRNLLPFIRAFGKTSLPLAEYDGLLLGHQLGCLLARLGWVALIPVGLALVGMVTGGFLLADDGKRFSMLRFGCHMLLVLRLVSSLLFLAGLYMGLCDDIPFLGGNMMQRLVDCLLCAVVVLPVGAYPLKDLDPEDPDFLVRERKALEELQHNDIGLVELCRYVYDKPYALQSWYFLMDKFRHVMDPDDMAIMAGYGKAVLSHKDFRKVFADWLLEDSQEEGTFDSAVLPDVSNDFSSSGSFLIRYMGFQKKLVIPPFWLIIESGAAAENLFLKEVSIPDTVFRIDEDAFCDCTSLEQVQLRQGLRVLGDHAFCGTALKQIHLPSGLYSLGKGCFQKTALESVQIPGTVKKIPEDCFAENSCLQTAVLEEGVEEIGPGAFRNCTSLRCIHIPNSIRFIHPSAFIGCKALVQVETADGWRERSVDPLLSVMFPDKEKEED